MTQYANDKHLLKKCKHPDGRKIAVKYRQSPMGLQSDQFEVINFSEVIEFHDKKIPHDEEILTEAKLLNLAVMAYNQMIEHVLLSKFTIKRLPGAMAACAYKGRIFICSSLKPPTGYEPSPELLLEGCVGILSILCPLRNLLAQDRAETS